MKKRILVFVLALALLCTMLPQTTTNAESFGTPQYKKAVLDFDMAKIKTVGTQIPYQYACSCFALAYCTTILDNRVHYFSEYNEYGTSQSNVNCWWSWGNYKSEWHPNISLFYAIIYDEIVSGSPIIVKVTGRGSKSHFVTIVGVENVTTYEALSAANFLILDPVVSTLKIENMSAVGYSFLADNQGQYQLVRNNTSKSVELTSIEYANTPSTPSTPMIKKTYPSYCAIKTVGKTYIKSLPCSKDSDPNSIDVEVASDGTQYQAIGLVENKYGNLWYKVKAKNGSTGYIYAGNAKYLAHSLNDIKGSGITAPTNHTLGKYYTLTGTVSSTYNQLTQVAAYIYSGNNEQGTRETGGSATVSGNSYSLKNSSIDYKTEYNKIPVGTHTYVVWASYKNYYAKSATTLGTNTGEIAVYTATFKVTSNATSCSHSYSSKVTKAATCVNNGTRTYTCSKCGASYTETIPATGHSWKNATCTSPKYCTTCGTTSGSANGHSWKNATCTTPKYCTTCGTTSGSANGHSWKNATCTTPKYCTTCGTTSGSSYGHSWKNATCTTPKYCTTCGTTSGSAKGHNWQNGVCTVCGESYEFAPTNLSMVIGNTLRLYLWVPISDIPSEGCYARIEQITETGYRSTSVNQIVWIRDDAAGVWKIPYSGVAAKEMTDQITMTVYDASGKPLTKGRTTTIESYALSQLSKTNNAELKTVLVDMLNYGAEAQKYFGYKEETLANANLTKEQKKYATASVKAEDHRKVGGNITASLSLENSLEMNFMVRGEAYTKADYAVVTLTNHYGEDFSFGYTLVEKQYNGATVGCITVDLLAVADAKTMVLCEVYDVNGNRLTYCDYSIETYVARMSNAALADINDAIMKFGVSAYNYFH